MNLKRMNELPHQSPMCIQCHSTDVIDCGKLPTAQFSSFNANDNDVVLPDGSRLYTCTNCRLHFRHPTLSPNELVEWYQYLPATSWTYEWPLHYWPTVRTWLTCQAPGRRLLEIGCFRGEFLEWMQPEWTVAAVEPSIEAKTIAMSKGIRVIGDSIFEVMEQFDAVVLFDVLEHLSNPIETMRAIQQRLAPHGVVVALTGNADAPTFRLLGRHYWYAMYFQHVAFHSPRSIQYLAKSSKLSVNRGEYLCHSQSSRSEWLHQGAYAAAAALRHTVDDYNSMALIEVLRRVPKVRHIVHTTDRPCSWMSARDHILVMLKNEGPSMIISK